MVWLETFIGVLAGLAARDLIGIALRSFPAKLDEWKKARQYKKYIRTRRGSKN